VRRLSVAATPMNIQLTNALVTAVLALLAGILILVAPKNPELLRGGVSEFNRFVTTGSF
jgi:hypothetical protein